MPNFSQNYRGRVYKFSPHIRYRPLKTASSTEEKPRSLFAVFIILLFTVIFLMFYLSVIRTSVEIKTEYFDPDARFQEMMHLNESIDRFLAKGEFLINTTYCKIPNIAPFSPEIIPFYEKKSYVPCTKKPLLTYIKYKNDVGYLTINASARFYYSHHVSCCYSEVTRPQFSPFWSPTLSAPDDTIRISRCIYFQRSVRPLQPIVKVDCYGLSRKVYSNVHAILSPVYLPSNREYQKKVKETPSVLIMGIDSVSKLNLIRTMPKTFEYLETHDFLTLQGFSKIGLNTFPIIYAMFTGKRYLPTGKTCRDQVDTCEWIYSRLHDIGYVTAYGEDWSSTGTFNYLSKGFVKPPTDIYLRPYILAAENQTISKSYEYECTGPENTAERIFNAALDFQKSFRKFATFGHFWVNSFSHNIFNAPSAMDDKVYEFLMKMNKQIKDDNTIFIFMSDHGFRFGDVRNTQAGRIEDSLPYFYIYFPKEFKEMYPKKLEVFRKNNARLVTVYDIYMTFQEIFHQANPKFKINQTEGCPHCNSLFEEIPTNRTCWSAGIDWEFCVCEVSDPIDPKSELVKNASLYVVERINKFVANFTEGFNCKEYILEDVKFAGKVIEHENMTNHDYLLLRLLLTPNAVFEVLMSWNYTEPNALQIQNFERLNWYGNDTQCVLDKALKRFCHC